MSSDRLLSLSDVATRTATSVAFWRKLVARRAIPVVRIGSRVRVRETDLEVWLRTGAPTGEKGGGMSINKSAFLDFIAALVRLLERLIGTYWRM